MAPPATIPMTTSQSTAGTGAQSQPPIATPAFCAFLSRLSSSIRQGFSQRRPWYELIDRSAMARPDNLTDAYSRIRRNLSSRDSWRVGGVTSSLHGAFRVPEDLFLDDREPANSGFLSFLGSSASSAAAAAAPAVASRV
ncbi:PRA1 family protein B1 [Hibiscus syriacus]|uniref:PRA1 family protein n=1 Tax=Hibiscus syriacus TaxID=106335 RepID=A0A6A3AZ78_HIBSY|nr:PRA1 family protein B1 [Hibiscus syriacus]